MGLTNTGGDLIVTNQLKIDIRVISRAQAWAEQVKGVYHFLYPHIVDDFAHVDDIQEWIDKVFAKHKHMRPGCQGGAITEPTMAPESSSQVPDKKGKSLLQGNSVLGKVRKGMSDLARLVAGIDRVNNQELK
jgi:hypothetical protein